MKQATRGAIVAVALALTAGVIAWNGLFGLYVSRGERQYLVQEARFRLGEQAAPSLPHIMQDAVREGVIHATFGGGAVLLLALAASYAGSRARVSGGGRRERGQTEQQSSGEAEFHTTSRD